MKDYKLKFIGESQAKQVLSEYTYIDESGIVQWKDSVIAIPELRTPSTLTETENGPVYVLGDIINGYFVLLRSKNRHLNLSEYITEENIGVSFGPLPDPPSEVGPLQFRRALRQVGLKNMIDAAISVQSDEIRESWEYATVFKRNDPLLLGLASQLGISQSVVDEVFWIASEIE